MQARSRPPTRLWLNRQMPLELAQMGGECCGATSLYTGTLGMFHQAGSREVRRWRENRSVVRLDLAAGR
nr:hypothetical protein KPHV_86980 [Kitasatospora purpeofusca]